MPQRTSNKLLALLRELRIIAITVVGAMAIAGSVRAQTVSSPSTALGAPDRTEILFLGTAAGPPLRLERSEASTLLVVDGRPYLIDCGIGTIQRMLRAGIQSEQIKTIFFTHLHADHDLGLADVMANDFLRLNAASSSAAINIYGPPQTRELVDAAFHFVTMGFRAFAAEPGAARDALVNGEFKSPFVAHEIQEAGLVYQDDKIRVTAAENSHYALMPAQSRQQMKSYSYRIETPHGVVVFTGDTGPSDAVVALARGADVLIAEVENLDQVTQTVNLAAEQNHWRPERTAAMMAHMREEHLDEKDVGEMASRAQVKSVVLYHYNPSDRAAYVASVKEHFSGPVFASVDLDRYCLGADSGDRTGHAPLLRPCPESSPRLR